MAQIDKELIELEEKRMQIREEMKKLAQEREILTRVRF